MTDSFEKRSEEYNRILFPYAYNILGSAEDAKDAMQDVLMKYLSVDKEGISDEKNYLIRAVINTAINMKNRQQRTLRTGELWLPEPVATEDAADRNLYLNEVLSYSLLVLMERLEAKERAVFILKETFDYSHADIAGILNITEEHSRKLLSRAKASLFKPAPKRTQQQMVHQQEVLSKLMSAIRQRDIKQVEDTMAADIRFYADGGGKVPLLATRSEGAASVATLLMTAYHQFLSSAIMSFSFINHQPALLSYRDGHLTSCQVFDLHPRNGSILQIHAVLDPGKLTALQQKPEAIINRL